jgi:hypothetical protein
MIELSIRGPPFSGQERGRSIPEGVAKGNQPKDGKPGHYIGNARDRHDTSKQHRSEPANDPAWPRWLPHELGLRYHDVGPTFNSAHQVRNELRIVRKVGVHKYRGIAFGPVGTIDRLSEQLLDGGSIADTFPVPGHSQWQNPHIPLEHFSGRIIRSIVQYQELVLPRKSGEYLTHLPEKQPDRRGFVVARYADVNHEPSRE